LQSRAIAPVHPETSKAALFDVRCELLGDDRPRDRDWIGEGLGSDDRGLDVGDAPAMLGRNALARAVRLKRAFEKHDRPAGAVRNDEGDRISRAPSNRLAGQEFVMGVKQDRGGLRLVNIDPQAHALVGGAMLDIERPAAHAQTRVGADDEDERSAMFRGIVTPA
jgi:hypothetical protein